MFIQHNRRRCRPTCLWLNVALFERVSSSSVHVIAGRSCCSCCCCVCSSTRHSRSCRVLPLSEILPNLANMQRSNIDYTFLNISSLPYDVAFRKPYVFCTCTRIRFNFHRRHWKCSAQLSPWDSSVRCSRPWHSACVVYSDSGGRHFRYSDRFCYLFTYFNFLTSA